MTASLMALTGLARTALLAGFAANLCFSFVNGLMPSRAGRAGFFTTTNFAKPGRTKTPFFLSSLCPTVTSVSTTVFTCLREISSPPIASVTACRTALFERGLPFAFFAVLDFAMFEAPYPHNRTLSRRNGQQETPTRREWSARLCAFDLSLSRSPDASRTHADRPPHQGE